MGIHSSALQHEQHLIAAYTATRPMASMYANWHTQQARPMGCCVCQLAYTIAQLAYTIARQANGWDVVYANWHTQHANGLLCMPIGYCVSLLAYTTSYPLVCCVCQLGYTTAHWPGCCVCQLGYCVCQLAYTAAHPLAWLLCIPIGIHNSPLS
jgi:hypothetical protein